MVDFALTDSPRFGVDARIGPDESVVRSVLDAVCATSVEETLGDGTEPRAGGIDVAPPLYEYVDPDALESLYAHAQTHPETASWTTTFEYADATVSVTSAGTVTVEPGDTERADARAHDCPGCEDASVDVADGRFVVDATLQCPECGHEWAVSF